MAVPTLPARWLAPAGPAPHALLRLSSRLACACWDGSYHGEHASCRRLPPRAPPQALKGEPLTLFGDGKQTRSFQYVSDLIEGGCMVPAGTQNGSRQRVHRCSIFLRLILAWRREGTSKAAGFGQSVARLWQAWHVCCMADKLHLTARCLQAWCA